MSIDRQAMIDQYISECTECGGREFPKRADCDGCISAVDECIATMEKQVSIEADRIAAITRAIAMGAA